MHLIRPLLLILFVHVSYLSLYCQCPNADETRLISSGSCVGSTLTVQSKVSPESIVWKMNNSQVVSRQNAVFNPSGATIAGGNGNGPAANQLSNPDRTFIDKNGAIYIPDIGNNRIQKWLPG